MNAIRPGMGTEHSSDVLAAIVQMARPRLVVEIGAGDSTVAIARALQRAHQEWEADANQVRAAVWQERTALLDPSGIPEKYSPKLITVDDFSGEGSSAKEAWATLRAAGIADRYIEFAQTDFFKITDEVLDSWGDIDIAWVDAGTPADDVRFISTLWDRIAPGGYILLHEPTMVTTVRESSGERVRSVRSPIWEELLSRRDNTFEVITLPESHKYRQSGLGIIRKRPRCEQFTRRASLQQELIVLGEAPIRGSTLQIGISSLEQRRRRDTVIGAMTATSARSVYASIILGARTISEVVEQTKLNMKVVSRTVTRLLAVGLIKSSDTGLVDSESLWHEIQHHNVRDAVDLTDIQLEDPVLLTRIGEQFRAGVAYSESEVSSTCQLFSDDFARLRRRLIDDGILFRDSNNVYHR